MARTKIVRLVAVPTWSQPTISGPTPIGTSYPSGPPLLAPRPMEHPTLISSTAGHVPSSLEPSNDSTLATGDRL